jgi:AbrB family looped-hinge helix DNA binding protein
MEQATVSSKNQIVIPREARKALGLRAGDQVLVVVRGKSVLVLKKPESHRAALRGLAGSAYPARYLQKERRSWG